MGVSPLYTAEKCWRQSLLPRYQVGLSSTEMTRNRSHGAEPRTVRLKCETLGF